MNQYKSRPTDPAKLAMRRIVRMLNLLALPVREKSSLLAEAKDPGWRRRYLRTRLHKIPYERFIGACGFLLRPKPTLVTDRAWQTLIVLDACRWDSFHSVFGNLGYGGKWTLDSITSPASNTQGWIRRNFVINRRKETLRDVIVVSTNPYLSQGYFDMQGWEFPFHSSRDLWKTGWDERLQTVLPEVVVETGLSLALGGKRMIIHFLQPHEPYIEYPELTETFYRLDQGSIPIASAREAYQSNVRIALESALKLAASLRGPVVITSDHGELFGEYGLYGHPPGVHVPELIRVPWLELQGREAEPRELAEEALDE
ncbi:MAG: hypothetical protein GTO63_29345 [Anaerolineae bacterium]|nr:hypothetical protein [Anaerolineae bacterium]